MRTGIRLPARPIASGGTDTGPGRAAGMPDTGWVSEQLEAIPPARRRRMALVLAPLGGVLLAAGLVTVSRHGVGWTVLGLLVELLALVLVGIAWGLWRSAALTEATQAEQRLDEVLLAATAGAGCAPGGVSAGTGSAGSTSAGAGGAADGPGGARCGGTGLACPAGAATGGCGASCLTR